MESVGNGLRVEKLTESNFHTWKLKIQLLLSYRELEQFIEQHDPHPPDSDLWKEWRKKDRKTMAIIGLSLCDIPLEHVADAETAHGVWRCIPDVFERHTMLNLLTARRNFYTTNMT